MSRTRASLIGLGVVILVMLVAAAGVVGQEEGASPSAGPGFATPEEAVHAYLDAVAAADFEALLATTAVEEQATRFDLAGTVARIRAFVIQLRSPADYPFYVEINRALALAEHANAARFIAYGLLTDVDILAPITDVDSAWADDFIASVDPARLAALEVIDVGIPLPDLLASERYQEVAAEQARSDGFEQRTERVALVSLEGESSVIGFTLVRTGDAWKVLGATSPLSGLGPTPPVEPTTLEAYAELTGAG